MADNYERKPFTPRPKNVLDGANLRKFGMKKLEGATKKPSLAPSLRNEKWGVRVYFTVYTNVEGERDNGRIEFPMDLTTFNGFLGDFANLINTPVTLNAEGKAEPKIKIDFKDYNFIKGTRTDDRMLKSSLIAGRHENGSIYVSVVSWSDKISKVPFFFIAPEEYQMYRNGVPYTKAEESNAIATGWLESLRGLVPIAVKEVYVPQEQEQKKDDNKSSGGYGGQQNHDRGQQQRQPTKPPADDFGSDSFDDDVPM